MKHIIRKILISTLLISFISSLYAKRYKGSVAVVVDKVTYQKIEKDVNQFTESMQSMGKEGILIIERWGLPDSLRAQLRILHKENNLEGAVLIGDVPIPMVREANYLTTGFKMSSKRPWIESSVPSDRFYDCFDLEFTFLKRDTADTRLFYYSLNADSPQRISCDIWTSRIKPMEIPGSDKYQLIAEYLQKAYRLKAESRKELDNILVFAGHGYNSESMNARIDEVGTLRSQFPSTWKSAGSRVDFLNFDYKPAIKFDLMKLLSNERYGLAIFHHHGSPDAQHVSPLPKVASSVSLWKEAIQMNTRVKIANAKNPQKTKEGFIKNYGIPESWMETSPEIAKSDSTVYANTDLTTADMEGYRSNASVILLDACFNGAFIESDYIAARYIFNPGKTMVVKANSVNTLQDTWTNELLGLLGAGVSVGNWAKGQMTLESHLFGDASFTFANSFPKYNIETAMLTKAADNKYWRTLLGCSITDFESLAIKRLATNGAISMEELYNIENSNPNPILRLSAFMAIKRESKGDLYSAIERGMKDSYELLARLASLTGEVNGDPRFTALVKELEDDPATSPRVRFHIMGLKPSCMPKDADLKEFEDILSPDVSARDKSLTLNAQRLKCNPYIIEPLFKLFAQSSNKGEKLQIADLLGWYRYSYRRFDIVERCRLLIENETDPDVKRELIRTVNRLTNL